MKKLLFGIAALGLLATASCKKDDKDNGPSNRIVVDGTTYATSTFTVFGPLVAVGGTAGTDAASITFDFGNGTATPSTGTYKVVADADAADEVTLTVANTKGGTATTYMSQDAGSVNVVVGKDGDKLTISLPSVQVKQMTGGSATINVSAEAKQM